MMVEATNHPTATDRAAAFGYFPLYTAFAS
jgi:hypothetical protein